MKDGNKRVFKLVGKVSVIIFLMLLVAMLCFVFGTKNEVVQVPKLLGRFFMVSTIVSLICVIIGAILDLIAGIRTRRSAYFKEYIMQILLFFMLYLIGDYFIEAISGNLIEYLVKGISVAVGIRAIGYIWAKEEKGE